MTKRSSNDPRVTRVLAAGKEGGRHSPLYRWMKENHAALAAAFAANGPQWDVRARAMGEAGLVDAHGQPPSQRTAMNTWYKVCRDLGTSRRQHTAEAASPSPASTRAPAARSTVEPSQPAADNPDDEEEEIEWTTADGTPHRTKIPKQK